MAVFLTGAFNLSQTPTPTSFLARACSSANCTFSGQPVHFDLALSRGLPDTYEYDWNGDGVFEETGSVAIPTHLYASAGTFRPVVRLRRGSWSSTLVHPMAISIGIPDVFRTPNAPVSPRVVFQRDRVPTLSDPPGTLTSRDLTLEASSPGTRGFLLYAALDGGSFFYLTSLPAAPGLLPFSIPFQTRILTLKIFAFNDYGPSASATFVSLSLP